MAPQSFCTPVKNFNITIFRKIHDKYCITPIKFSQWVTKFTYNSLYIYCISLISISIWNYSFNGEFTIFQKKELKCIKRTFEPRSLKIISTSRIGPNCCKKKKTKTTLIKANLLALQPVQPAYINRHTLWKDNIMMITASKPSHQGQAIYKIAIIRRNVGFIQMQGRLNVP